MAKYKRVTVGDIVKGKDGKPDYIKVQNDVVLKRGDYLNLESKAQQLKNLDESLSSGRISGEFAEQLRERIEKIPDFVRFQIIRSTKED